MSIKVLHTADTHFGNKAAKLAEAITTSDFLIARAHEEQPDVAIIAGDVVDEHDGPIRIDSEAARAAIRFVTELAAVCPVVIIRGTRSHDRETPYLFSHLRTRHAVHVGSKIEMVALLPDNTFAEYNDDLPCMSDEVKAVFTLIPSPDKCNVIAASGCDTGLTTTMVAKEALNDMLGYIGDVNAAVPDGIPRILVAHGMITGAEYSSGATTTGEDFEYGLSDLALTNTDLKAFGHIHKHQSFPGNVFFAGSPGRLSMGETEIKGFLIHSFDGRVLDNSRFIETPARRFALHETTWNEDGVDGILTQLAACEAECADSDVRFRYTVPEEHRHQINREELAARLLAAGARSVKIEPTIIPKIRQRAAGISQLSELPEKVEKYCDTAQIEVPARVLYLASTIEGRDVEELIADAKRTIAAGGAQRPTPVLAASIDEVVPEQPAAVTVTTTPQIAIQTPPPTAADQYHHENASSAVQFDLFA